MNKKFKSTVLVFLITIFTFTLVGCSNNAETNTANDTNSDTATIKTMTGEDLVKQNSGKNKDKVLIIDVRTPEEYKEGHLPHAINIFIDEFEERLGEIEDLKDSPIITYCNTGNKSGQAAEILVNNGFKDVTNAEGVKEFDYDLVHYDDLRGAAFQNLIDTNEDIILVDVREEKQVKDEGMIEGAINVPFNAVEEHLDKLPEDKTIALYCNTGTKSAEVAKQLEELGYGKVVNAVEGVKEHSFTLVK